MKRIIHLDPDPDPAPAAAGNWYLKSTTVCEPEKSLTITHRTRVYRVAVDPARATCFLCKDAL